MLDKWLDGVEEGWAIPLMLAIFVALWTAYLALAYVNAGLHPDVLEVWTLGRAPAWGGLKHPPLMGSVSYLWTFIFPARDWSYQLMAMVNSAVALWMVDLITRRYARGDKRVIVLLLLMLLPVYQFEAQRFNANSVLFAVWPLAIYCFMKSFETRHPAWAVAAGLAAAAAMLGKYYSAFLIAGFVFAAICHPGRRSYFTSSAPWISSGAGLLLLAPHVYWLAANNVGPFDYALGVHGGMTAGRSFLSGVSFLLGLIATLALPLVIWCVMIRSRFSGYLLGLKSLDSGLLLLLLVAIGAVVTPPIVSVVLKSSLSPVWASPGLFAFVLVAVCAAKFPVDRVETRRLALGILAFAMCAVVAAPVHAYYRNTHPYKEGRNYYRLAAQEVTQRWRQLTPEPLKATNGEALAMALAFYGSDHPAYLGWQKPTDAQLRAGWATMCLPDEASCLAWSKQVAAATPGAVSFDFTVQPRLWGQDGVPSQIFAVLIPPPAAK